MVAVRVMAAVVVFVADEPVDLIRREPAGRADAAVVPDLLVESDAALVDGAVKRISVVLQEVFWRLCLRMSSSHSVVKMLQEILWIFSYAFCRADRECQILGWEVVGIQCCQHF